MMDINLGVILWRNRLCKSSTSRFDACYSHNNLTNILANSANGKYTGFWSPGSGFESWLANFIIKCLGSSMDRISGFGPEDMGSNPIRGTENALMLNVGIQSWFRPMGFESSILSKGTVMPG